MRFLILANDGDATAERIAAVLRARHGFDAAALVTMRDLAGADGFTHALNGSRIHSTIRLRSGTTIDSDNVGAVLNRLRHVAVPRFARAEPSDRDYATMETYALLISWLTSLPCPIVNRGGSPGLSAIPRGALEWFQLAARAGLRTPRLCVSSSLRRFGVSDLVPLAATPTTLRRRGWFMERLGPRHCSVHIAGTHVVGDLPVATHHAIRRFAASAGVSLARLDFRAASDSSSWVFVGIDEWPDLVDRDSIDAATLMLEDMESRKGQEKL